MPSTAEIREPIALVTLEGELTIYTAAEVKARWLAALEPSAPLILDLAQVSEIDAAGVQLLLLVRRELAAAGHRPRLAGCSPAVREALQLCNLTHAFDEPDGLG